MKLEEVLMISGKPGLYKLISKGKTNFIVESLVDGKRMPAFSHDGVSSLENISIYGVNEDIKILDVFKQIYNKEKGNKIENIEKDEIILKKYFAETIPNYDKDRVYANNIKKVIRWYNILIDNNLDEILKESPEETNNKENEEKIEESGNSNK